MMSLINVSDRLSEAVSRIELVQEILVVGEQQIEGNLRSGMAFVTGDVIKILRDAAAMLNAVRGEGA
ncbi:MAG: hypothetical protein ACOYU2_04400 [Nitrospirota bacterium]